MLFEALNKYSICKVNTKTNQIVSTMQKKGGEYGTYR